MPSDCARTLTSFRSTTTSKGQWREHSCLLAAVLLVNGCVYAHAQSPPKFEVASIRPCRGENARAVLPGARKGGRAGGLRSDPGNLHIGCETVEQLINWAYLGYADGKTAAALTEFPPIAGESSWVASDQFTVDAKPSRPETVEMMRGPMMQRLLEERCRLKLRRLSREIPAYALRIRNGGLRLQPARGANCIRITFNPSAPAVANPSNLPACGFFGAGENGTVQTLGQTMEGLSAQISAWIDQKVVDRTRLTGVYDIVLNVPAADFMPQRSAAADPVSQPPMDRAGEISGALGKLGLKLERARISIVTLAIDHIERPSEN